MNRIRYHRAIGKLSNESSILTEAYTPIPRRPPEFLPRPSPHRPAPLAIVIVYVHTVRNRSDRLELYCRSNRYTLAYAETRGAVAFLVDRVT